MPDKLRRWFIPSRAPLLNDSNNAQAGDFYSVEVAFGIARQVGVISTGRPDGGQCAPISRIAVKRELLRWARERSGLQAADLVQRFPQNQAWESGDEQLTFRQLEKLRGRLLRHLPIFSCLNPRLADEAAKRETVDDGAAALGPHLEQLYCFVPFGDRNC